MLSVAAVIALFRHHCCPEEWYRLVVWYPVVVAAMAPATVEVMAPATVAAMAPVTVAVMAPVMVAVSVLLQGLL